MLLKMFSIYDNAAQAFINPFYLPEQLQAERAFTDMVNDPNHAFGKHPEDYTLFYLGDWENVSCNFELLTTPRKIGLGIEFQTQMSIGFEEEAPALLKEQTS